MKVDIKQVLKDKNPRLERWMPGFVKNYLRRIVHEDDLNFLLENYSHLSTIEFVRACLNDMGITYSSTGMDSLDQSGRYIFASNHPFGGLDGLMLADEVSKKFGDVRVVVNDLLMNIDPLKSIFIPVNKHGRQSAEYARLYKEAFESDMPIVTFPAGLCSRRSKGVVADVKWRPSFVKQAVSTQRDIVPVFFSGSLSDFFYNLSNFRTRVGVKANIEMLYLVDEMFRQKGRNFDIMVGKPIKWEELQDQNHHKATELIRTKAYSLKK